MSETKITLAEALQSRADLNKRLEQLRSRLVANAVTQEGVETAEDPAQLLSELDGCLKQLEELTVRINQTNSQTQVDGEPLTALLARRDMLKLRLSTLRAVCDAAMQPADRYSRSEIRQLRTVDVKQLQRQLDKLSADYRRLDNSIQAANWRTELL